MTKPIATALITIALFSLGSTSRVDAQTSAAGPDNFFNATFGAQPQRRTIDAVSTATIFDEAATFTTEQRIGNGPFFDLTVGHRMFQTLIVGFAFTSFSSVGSAAGIAAIPDPLFVGRPNNVAIEARDLKRSEQGYHLQAVWFKPVSKKIDLAVAVGPSLMRVSQQFSSGSLNETTQTVTFGPDKETGLGFGFNAGADFTYLLTPKYGIGMLLRYTWASVALDAADVTAGGFQGGLGLRLRF